MSKPKLILLTVVAILAFAGNSLLCRFALANTSLDAASFTSIRICSGALMLFLLSFTMKHSWSVGGNWWSALALFGYAAGFSFAYVKLSAATGALLMYGAIQCTMIVWGLLKGERINLLQAMGMLVAVAGLIGLLLPGLSAPPILSAAIMLGAGISWGIYSLRGRGARNARHETTGNFIRAVPFALLISALSLKSTELNLAGVGYAIASGALTSGLGYVIWYAALPALTATSAATIQLTVPVLVAVGGLVFIGEPITLRVALTSVAILGGVAVFIWSKGIHRVKNAEIK